MNFNEFFNTMIKKYSLQQKWKEAVIAHLKSIDHFKDRKKWEDGVKHFLGHDKK